MMSDTLKPQDLTAEERAIVDGLFLILYSNYGTETEEERYAWAIRKAEPIILARRKFYGAPKEAKAEEVEHADLTGKTLQKFPVGHCIVCGELVAPYNAHAKYEGGYTCQPAPPPAPVLYVCPNCDKQTATKQEHEIPIRDTGLCRFSCTPAPVASELPDVGMGKIRLALETAKAHWEPNCQGGGGLPMPYKLVLEALKEADALEAWARSLAAAKPRSYGALMSILYSLCTNAISIGKAQKVLMQWGNGEDIEDYAEADADKVHALMFGENERSLPTASAQLPKVRELIFYVRQLTPHLTNLGYADLSRSFEDHAAAALAELDAAQAVGMTPELARLLEFAENNVENRCGEIRHEMPRVIAAVRAQAANAQPNAVEVPAEVNVSVEYRESRYKAVPYPFHEDDLSED